MKNYIALYYEALENIVMNIEALGYNYTQYVLKMFGIQTYKLVRVIRYCAPAIMFMYAIFCSIYFIFKSIISFFTYRTPKEIVGKEVYLLFSYLLSVRVKNSDLKYYDGLWVLGPGMTPSNLPDKCERYIRITELYDRSSILNILKDSLNGCKMSFRRNAKLIPLHKLFNYLEVCYSLEKLSCDSTIYFSNQSDRWALLFDSLNVRKKILLQHGVDIKYPLNYNKLQDIDVFYSINSKSYQASYKYLLQCTPELRFLNPTIQLSSVDVEKYTVLLITHPLFFTKEKIIIEQLSLYGDVKLYIKKHPTSTNDSLYLELKKKHPFEYIVTDFFPRVDCVISYESTLAYEYQGFDIPVIMYESDDSFSIEKVMNEFLSIKESM